VGVQPDVIITMTHEEAVQLRTFIGNQTDYYIADNTDPLNDDEGDDWADRLINALDDTL
jgi:hypothetical protein